MEHYSADKNYGKNYGKVPKFSRKIFPVIFVRWRVLTLPQKTKKRGPLVTGTEGSLPHSHDAACAAGKEASSTSIIGLAEGVCGVCFLSLNTLSVEQRRTKCKHTKRGPNTSPHKARGMPVESHKRTIAAGARWSIALNNNRLVSKTKGEKTVVAFSNEGILLFTQSRQMGNTELSNGGAGIYSLK